MICLVDQNLPPALAAWLRSSGVPAVHVSEAGLADRADADIVAMARTNNYTIISKDGDFAFSGPPPVVWVRLGNVTNARLLQAFEASWSGVRAALESGETLVEIR
jgi:predicted nuclease of predicted toxin-antitoxin system